jgi:hypothetical protein
MILEVKWILEVVIRSQYDARNTDCNYLTIGWCGLCHGICCELHYFQALWNVLSFWNGVGTVEVQLVRVTHSIYTCGGRCLLFKANLTEIQFVAKGMTLTSPIVSSSWSWWRFYGRWSIPGLFRMLWCVFFLLFSLRLSSSFSCSLIC